MTEDFHHAEIARCPELSDAPGQLMAMALWLYGFMALWLYGFMALWQRHPGALAILARQVDNAPMHHDNYRKCRDRNRSDSNLRAEALSAVSVAGRCRSMRAWEIKRKTPDNHQL